ncbi:helix-turn-helix domain-containing protein [Kaustia mangrovi]|uniref:Helix-turn-helix domain-containing protein n=1 Tax=Kaustia mangrovi TaxID=2593653 RepID=A0A7S8C6Z5_9HYPH|nr:helix-turn-helix domain-containing protein [Kaustia mangrovi]QPC44481.1 helix-turn-helix domain-containing protein [Kaustia mangrovi]
MFQLRIRGLSTRRLAAREGCSRQAISAAATGFGSSHLEEALAHAIDLTPQKLFPEHYDANGQRIGWTRVPNRSGHKAQGNVKTTDAA